MTARQVIISIDAMGGDDAPNSVINGSAIAMMRYPNLKVKLFGDKSQLENLCAEKLSKYQDRYEIEHSDDVVAPDEKPSVALRKGRASSMRHAIDSVKNGDADAVVSAGNTGALMAMSKYVLKTLPDIHRPAIASMLPTKRGDCVMLDLGANVSCNEDHLCQFAFMGSALAKTILGFNNPRVALLNVGEEEVKGNYEVQQAYQRLNSLEVPFDFIGFVEGNDIASGNVDVVVADGFSGNVALKTAEGTADLIAYYLSQAMKSSFLTRLGYALMRSSMKTLADRLNPQLYNGALFLGMGNVVVKSHGGANEQGIANALGVAYDAVWFGFNDLVITELHKMPIAASLPAEADI